LNFVGRIGGCGSTLDRARSCPQNIVYPDRTPYNSSFPLRSHAEQAGTRWTSGRMDPNDAIEPREPRWLRLAAAILTNVAAGFIFALMVLIFADVIARYALNRPIHGAFEIVEFILAIAVFVAIALVSYRNDHITVSVLDHLFRDRIRWYQQAFVLLFSAVTVGFIAYRLFASAEKMRQTGLLALMFDIQLAVIVYVMASMATVACLLIVTRFALHLRSPTAADGAPTSLD
jgi:TRAP-type C4-dicarboxylate transport system permease small subunit